MSGQEPTRRATSGSARGGGVKRSEMMPVILVPTPAQLAAGVRVIDADPESWPRPVASMVKLCEANGWSWRVTYSQFLDLPVLSGELKGERLVTHVLMVRAWRGNIRVWGTWHGTDGKPWKPQGAQAVDSRRCLTPPFGVTDMENVLRGRKEPGGGGLADVAMAE